MTSRPVKVALSEALDNLSKEDFEKFCFRLRSRKEEPRVARSRVEDKSRLQVTDVLVSTFTEAGAVRVTVEILRQICCSEEADELEKETGGPSPKPGPNDTKGASAGEAGVKNMADDEHFVDKHRDKLIQRVANIPCILDELLQRKVIHQEDYDTIRIQRISQDKMRELYTHLNTRAGKDIFYELLKKHQKFLVDDLS